MTINQYDQLVQDVIASGRASDQAGAERYIRSTYGVSRPSAISSSPPSSSNVSATNPLTKTLQTVATEYRKQNMAMNDVIDLSQKLISTDPYEKLDAYKEMVESTDQLRVGLSQTFGMTEQLIMENMALYQEGAEAFDQFGITARDVFMTVSDATQDIGRNLRIPPDVAGQLTLIGDLYGTVAQQSVPVFVAGFEKIGRGSYEAAEAMENAIVTSQKMGLVTEKLLPAVGKQIEKVNLYGFKNGVQGLTSMVAEAELLGTNFDNVTQLAEKFFDPEAAIDFAAGMQMIGGTNMTDPLKLMYQSLYDIDGLMDDMNENAKSFATFNETTGEFEIDPANMIRMRDYAKLTNQSLEELQTTAIRGQKMDLAKSMLSGFDDEEVKGLIAGMSDFAEIDGEKKMAISLPGYGEIPLENLASLMEEDATILEALREQAHTDSLSNEQIFKDQLTANKATAVAAANIENMITGGVIMEGMESGTLGAGQNLAESVLTMSRDFSNKMLPGLDTLVSDSLSGIGDIVGMVQAIADDIGVLIKTAMDANTIDPIIVNDGTFGPTSEKRTLQIGPKGSNPIYEFSPDDTIQASTVVKSFSELTPLGGEGNTGGGGGLRDIKMTVSGNVTVNGGDSISGKKFVQLVNENAKDIVYAIDGATSYGG